MLSQQDLEYSNSIHLQRGKTYLLKKKKRLSWVRHKTASYGEALALEILIVNYSFIAFTPRSTLIQSGSTC